MIQPALFLIQREGHTNINQAEHLAAFRAINAWIEGGRDALPAPKDQAHYFDATVAPDPGPVDRGPAPRDNRGFTTSVAEVDAVYGNILLAGPGQGLCERGNPADDLLHARRRRQKPTAPSTAEPTAT